MLWGHPELQLRQESIYSLFQDLFSQEIIPGDSWLVLIALVITPGGNRIASIENNSALPK